MQRPDVVRMVGKFGAVFGFLSCVLMVLFAKALGVLLKRPNDYYREQEDDA